MQAIRILFAPRLSNGPRFLDWGLSTFQCKAVVPDYWFVLWHTTCHTIEIFGVDSLELCSKGDRTLRCLTIAHMKFDFKERECIVCSLHCGAFSATEGMFTPPNPVPASQPLQG